MTPIKKYLNLGEVIEACIVNYLSISLTFENNETRGAYLATKTSWAAWAEAFTVTIKFNDAKSKVQMAKLAHLNGRGEGEGGHVRNVWLKNTQAYKNW